MGVQIVGVQNSDNAGWVVVGETVPSGVSSVVHSGLESYDWIIAELSDVETSSSALIYLSVGWPGYNAFFYNRFITTTNQRYNEATMYFDNTNRTTARQIALSMPNMGRGLDAGGLMKVPFLGCGSTTNVQANNGIQIATVTSIEAVKYETTAGNLQGSTAVIRTWGWRG